MISLSLFLQVKSIFKYWYNKFQLNLDIANDRHDTRAVVGELLQMVIDHSMKPDTQLRQDELDVFAVQRFSNFYQLNINKKKPIKIL